MALAKKMGITVVQKESTESAFKYLYKHPHLKNVSSTEFRIVTDAYRDQDQGEKAGENFIARLRKEGWDVPVLIHCADMHVQLRVQSEYQAVSLSTTHTLFSMYLTSMIECKKPREPADEDEDDDRESNEDIEEVEECDDTHTEIEEASKKQYSDSKLLQCDKEVEASVDKDDQTIDGDEAQNDNLTSQRVEVNDVDTEPEESAEDDSVCELRKMFATGLAFDTGSKSLGTIMSFPGGSSLASMPSMYCSSLTGINLFLSNNFLIKLIHE